MDQVLGKTHIIAPPFTLDSSVSSAINKASSIASTTASIIFPTINIPSPASSDELLSIPSPSYFSSTSSNPSPTPDFKPSSSSKRKRTNKIEDNPLLKYLKEADQKQEEQTAKFLSLMEKLIDQHQHNPHHNALEPGVHDKLHIPNPEEDVRIESIPDELREEADYEKPRVSVPITLCLLILVGYISGGAILFSVWEKWDFLDGSYFCFVTLSTIGFGDLVPGDSVVNDSGSQEKLVICSLYLLVGMALIAMCFNLMQEEVIQKVRNCGRRIGIIKDTEDDEDLG